MLDGPRQVLSVLAFQSPNHRGVDCNEDRMARTDRGIYPFSPLIIGEWTATVEVDRASRSSGLAFSPLIIGEWTATVVAMDRTVVEASFQSPNHRGVDCNAGWAASPTHHQNPFSPLIIGEWTATRIQPWHGPPGPCRLSVP